METKHNNTPKHNTKSNAHLKFNLLTFDEENKNKHENGMCRSSGSILNVYCYAIGLQSFQWQSKWVGAQAIKSIQTKVTALQPHHNSKAYKMIPFLCRKYSQQLCLTEGRRNVLLISFQSNTIKNKNRMENKAIAEEFLGIFLIVAYCLLNWRYNFHEFCVSGFKTPFRMGEHFRKYFHHISLPICRILFIDVLYFDTYGSSCQLTGQIC